MLDQLLHALSFLPPELTTFLIAMLPVVELRGALPVALTVFQLPPASAIALSLAGNIIIVPPLLWFLRIASGRLRAWSPTFDRLFTRYIERTRRKFERRYEAWGIAALVLFVATPLPGTGAWTGTVAAWLMGIPFRRLFPAVVVGVCIAAALVFGITTGAISFFS